MLAQQRLAQAQQQAQAQSLDPASFFETLAPSLRQQVRLHLLAVFFSTTGPVLSLEPCPSAGYFFAIVTKYFPAASRGCSSILMQQIIFRATSINPLIVISWLLDPLTFQKIDARPEKYATLQTTFFWRLYNLDFLEKAP